MHRWLAVSWHIPPYVHFERAALTITPGPVNAVADYVLPHRRHVRGVTVGAVAATRVTTTTLYLLILEVLCPRYIVGITAAGASVSLTSTY
jgi:hypothetical protein